MITNTKRTDSVKQWQSLKFGLFIHWGLYAIPAKGEWYMYNEKVPVKEYEKYAADFQPKQYDPEEWVLMAKEAGMKYIVFTTKHHDGFSMFKSEVSSFNVVDATPYGKDVLKELADACRKHDMRLGLYYSHVREWRHPLAQSYERKGRPNVLGNYGNFWDYPDETKKDLQRYIDEFDKPQLDELLSNYGDILTIWFDTSSHISEKQAMELEEFVHSRQENCLINGRLITAHPELVDYLSMGDNAIPAFAETTPWETAINFCHGGWGYTRDAEFASHQDLLRTFVEIIAKGGNLLLNVGPDENGVVPEKARQVIKNIGQWVHKNQAAVYDVEPVKMPYLCDWGYASKRGNKMYLYIIDGNRTDVGLTGLMSKVISCRLLEENSDCLFSQNDDSLCIQVGPTHSEEIRVVEIECEGDVAMVDKIIPSYDGGIFLTAQNGTVHKNHPYSKIDANRMGVIRWFYAEDTISWRFSTPYSGTYSAEIVLAGGGLHKAEDTGHHFSLVIDGQVVSKIVCPEETPSSESKRTITVNGIFIEKGEHEFVLQPEKIITKYFVGLKFQRINLIKTDE